MEGPSHGGHQTQGGSLQPGWHHFDRRQPNNANQNTAGPITRGVNLLGYAYNYEQGITK
jgi:hypothetical protein